MPKKQSLPLQGGIINLTLICSFLFFLIISSCKSDKKTTSNPADLFDGPNSINFTINGEQLVGTDQINKDLTMLEYQEDRMNKDHVFYVPINDSIYFNDISQIKGGAPGDRQWYIDEQKLEIGAREVAFYSEEVGPAIVTLKFDDYNYVMKGIFFTDEFDFEDETAEVLDDSDSSEEEYVDDYSDEYEEPVKKQTQTSSSQTKRSSQVEKSNSNTPPNTVAAKTQKTTPQPVKTTSQPVVVKKSPPPVKKEIKTVRFSADKTSVETGEKIVFRDLSEPAVAINQRVWDWGDGNTMPTKGSTAGYSYYKPGTYTVKLCLNYSSKCSTKTITVKEKKKAIVAAPPTPKKEKIEPKKEIKVGKVVISSASKTQVGKPIQISDNTYPKEAVKSRVWYINGEKTNLTNSKFSKTFDKPGKYSIKLCVNDDNSLCESKEITIAEKPKPAQPVVKKESKPVVEEEFFPMANSRTGLRSSQRCPENDVKWHTGEASLTLSPTVRMELLNARIYGKKVAQAAVTLTASDGSVSRKINNVQILPGQSTIEFGDFGVVLQPGIKYTITIKPMSGEQVSLEDGGSCNTSFAADNRLAVSYKDNIMTLLDIKFTY